MIKVKAAKDLLAMGVKAPTHFSTNSGTLLGFLVWSVQDHFFLGAYRSAYLPITVPCLVRTGSGCSGGDNFRKDGEPSSSL